MRGSVLLVIVILICLAALIKPRIGLYGYIWFGLMRPDYMAFAVGRYGMSTMLAVVTLVSAMRMIVNFRLLFKPIPILLILFQFAIAVSANNALAPQHAWAEFERYFRMMIMCLIIPVLVTNEDEFREMFLVAAASLGFLGFWWGLTAGLRGARIWYGPGGFMSDNNGFAVALAMIVPFCWHARTVVTQRWAKLVYSAMMVGSVAATVLTFSRGGALALAAGLIMLIVKSENRTRSVVMIVAVILPLMTVVGAAYQQRLSTIQTYEEDASAMSRILQMKIAVDVWKDHPMLGIGIGDLNYLYASRPYLTMTDARVIVHNSFLQVLVHTGAIGFSLYFSMLVTALVQCYRGGWRMWKKDRKTAVYPLAIFVALMAYIVGSLTHPRAWFDFFYMLLLFASTWTGIVQRRPRAAVASPNDAPRPMQLQIPRAAPRLTRA
jgi:putative inorganic carbon (HCO3(-)) transporter